MPFARWLLTRHPVMQRAWLIVLFLCQVLGDNIVMVIILWSPDVQILSSNSLTADRCSIIRFDRAGNSFLKGIRLGNCAIPLSPWSSHDPLATPSPPYVLACRLCPYASACIK
ncbi:hypothetical protein L208DRAFT_1003 [Tricholoma matsutake]|nr:hypothetical protein L208DRAFT_1003 [Tricholoma matsutake 945]